RSYCVIASRKDASEQRAARKGAALFHDRKTSEIASSESNGDAVCRTVPASSDLVREIVTRKPRPHLASALAPSRLVQRGERPAGQAGLLIDGCDVRPINTPRFYPQPLGSPLRWKACARLFGAPAIGELRVEMRTRFAKRL